MALARKWGVTEEKSASFFFVRRTESASGIRCDAGWVMECVLLNFSTLKENYTFILGDGTRMTLAFLHCLILTLSSVSVGNCQGKFHNIVFVLVAFAF